MENNEILKLNSDTVETITLPIVPSTTATIAINSNYCYSQPAFAVTPSVVEYHPLTCTKCGGQVEIKDGFGQCPYCKTCFSATIVIQET